MGRILCLDYGEVRIGVAISDRTKTIATTKKYISAKKNKHIQNILNFMEEVDADEIVIGLPLNLKGEDTQKTTEVRNFAKELEKLVTIPITLWDERYSTVSAEQILRDGNIRGKKQRQKVDSLAAQIILQNYLDYKKYKK